MNQMNNNLFAHILSVNTGKRKEATRPIKEFYATDTKNFLVHFCLTVSEREEND